MTDTHSAPATLPTRRSDLLNPPEEYRRLREEEPVSRLSFPDGTVGWLVTRYEDVRAVLADPRFSTYLARHSSPVRATPPEERGELPPGHFISMDAPDHTRYRRLLTGQFTVRRMRALIPRVEQIVNGRLDVMEQVGEPADLVEAFALPVAALVICELLGVSYDDREYLQEVSETLMSSDAPTSELYAAVAGLSTYLRDLVRAKHEQPGDDIISGLVTGDNGLTDEEIAGMALPLLLAGYDAAANMLGLGVLALLLEPDQLAPLRGDDQVAQDNLVEELLRYLTTVHLGTIRGAKEDVRVGGELVREGEIVVASLAAANRDPQCCPDPDRLDVTRGRTSHLAFGHGPHQCLGQQLARVVLKVGYRELFRRFPGLRLAVPPEEIDTRDDKVMYGVYALPVAWSDQ
ncbi:cytochrome P450 [Streptantibioticus rubrisoli]|uniref:Cytochrome P450 n=1 Tax=Streptantibioticus rubrisoli TaxID=1387313 RepID=A0ABT1PDF5_9ACTN|nr:cytochrome P450 [Streptantibioticus rubrisoli]MCQ4043399.1 cytochrome P450 [Streptantibioticus rubrisoli]